ncbi:hypothetical protein DFJ74DRAFT_10496 [Hyaloraphidium curvatum]|nr:hypothetical protein DFJ74DRAFT_10496 [Hyaloraphidium curvatum]
MASPQDPVVSASTANVTPAEALGSAASTGTGGAAPPSSIPLADLGASAAPQTTAAPATTTTITMPGPTKAPETVGVPPAAAAPASADAITTLPAVDGGKPTDAAGGVVANGTAGTGAKADGTDANAMAADPYADIFAQATEAQQKQDELDEDKVVVLRGLATSTYFSLRRFWHAYLLFSVYLIIVICAMSIQLSLFFTLIDPTGTAVNFSRIAARLSASLLVAILFSIFSSQCWEVLRAFWRGEDALVLRKGGYVRGWPKGLSKFIDIISQIAVIILMDIGPIIAAFGLFKGDNGQFIGYFFTAALTGAGVVVVIKILLEFINGAYQLIMLCVRRKWQPIPTLRQITRKAGYQQLESEQLFTTRKSTRDWFCLWIVDRSQDSAGGMLLACFLIIVVGVFVILGTIISSWFIMAEAVYLAFIFISWGWIKIWDPVIDYAKKEEEFNELTPLERTLIDRDLGGFDTKFNVRPIIYPWSTPTLRYASLMLIFGHIALMIWMSVLIGLKGYSLLLFLNLYIAIPYIVILCLYVYSMHPSNWKSDKAKSWCVPASSLP